MLRGRDGFGAREAVGCPWARDDHAVWAVADQAAVRELLQGFPDRGAADGKPLAEHALGRNALTALHIGDDRQNTVERLLVDRVVFHGTPIARLPAAAPELIEEDDDDDQGPGDDLLPERIDVEQVGAVVDGREDDRANQRAMYRADGAK